ncbi:MAG: hypothetical protein K9N49_09525 [Candidatus Marinimicrobia bacterium]|nr:hypothetical protein [Candidatus Neomarinimicrobiota bacterium]
MQAAQPSSGRIERQGRGVGGPTPDTVRRRAQELAEISGRATDDVTTADCERAARELQGEAVTPAADESLESGAKVAGGELADGQQITEEAVKEGVREAEHERMLAGARRES